MVTISVDMDHLRRDDPPHLQTARQPRQKRGTGFRFATASMENTLANYTGPIGSFVRICRFGDRKRATIHASAGLSPTSHATLIER
jgi:hypothetical protein